MKYTDFVIVSISLMERDYKKGKMLFFSKKLYESVSEKVFYLRGKNSSC